MFWFPHETLICTHNHHISHYLFVITDCSKSRFDFTPDCSRQNVLTALLEVSETTHAHKDEQQTHMNLWSGKPQQMLTSGLIPSCIWCFLLFTLLFNDGAIRHKTLFHIKGVITLHHRNDLLLVMKTASPGFPLMLL